MYVSEICAEGIFVTLEKVYLEFQILECTSIAQYWNIPVSTNSSSIFVPVIVQFYGQYWHDYYVLVSIDTGILYDNRYRPILRCFMY